MTVVPTSPKSTSTFKIDLTELAAYAEQPFAVIDEVTTVTSGTRLKNSLLLSPRSRFERCCAKLQGEPSTQRYPLLLIVILAAITLALATGCGYSGSVVPVAIGGSVHGGRRPVTGATVELYAAGTGGLGSASAPLLRKAVASDSNGNFTIPAEYGCPSPSSQIYVVARGGNATASAGANSALMLTALLGPCSGLSKLGSVAVNEVTTVGSVWPLAHYWKSPTHLGSALNDASFPDAVGTVPEFINLVQGSSPGTPTATSYFAENNKLYSLADVFAACVNSSGGKAGDGSPCGQLFSMASTAGSSAPTDTMTAAIQIAQQPDSNVAGIFDLVNGSTSFQPALTAVPADWTLTLSYVVATPSISLVTGTYTGTQEVTISDATEGSVIYYTTDGTTPTNSSNLFTGPISIGVSSTIKAMAFLAGSSSAVASSTLTITTTLPPAKLAFLQQPSNSLTGATISPAVQVVVEDANGNPDSSATNPITLSLVGGTGLGGTLTVTPQNGVATFGNLMVSTAGAGYALLATSPSLTSATSAGFTISAPSTGSALSPARLVFVQQPSNGLTGNPISPAVQVAVEDANGNIVTTALTPVTVTLTSSKGIGGTLWTALPQNGIATFSNVIVGIAGSGYTLFASSPALTSATSAPFTISAPGSGTPPSPFKLAFQQQPMNAQTQATITPAVQVVVEDANGNAVQGANNPITLLLSSGSSLNGTLTATPQNGVASFTNLSVSNAGTYTLQATSSGLQSATSASFTITAPSNGNGNLAAQLAFTQQPSNARTGATISPAVQVEVQDSKGNVVTTAVSPITISLAGGTGLGGTLTVSPQNGVATFSNLSVSAAGSGLTLTAASANLLPATSTPFNISAPGGGNPPASPVKLAFLQQPSNALTGATLSPAVQVVIEDANGNPVPAATNPISLTLAGGTGLGGTLTVTPQNGIATFSNLTVNTAGTGLTLLAASPNLTSATSVAFTINVPSSGPPPTPTRLAYLMQPSNALTGTAISPAVQVAVEDASGNVLPTATNPVTVALVGGTGLTGTLTVVPQNGIATFSNLSVSAAGIYTLSASSPSLTSATSTGFTITAPSLPTAVKLAFSVQPSNAQTQATITPAVQVLVEDSSGTVVTTATNPVTLALVGGTGLGGTLTVTPQNGVATFSNLSVSNAGSYTLSASSPTLTSAASTGFTITAPSLPTAVKLAFSVPPSNALTGATITPAVQVWVEDSSGTVVTTATNPVTLALVGGTGLGGTLTVTPQNGVATFSNLSVSNAGSYTLSASSPSLTSATSTGFTITAPSLPTAVKLAFSVQPSNALTQATITPAVQVLVEDSSGTVVTTATNPVTLALVGGTGLGGTLTVTPQNGVATFSNLSVSNAGSYTLSASSPTLASATSTGFTITAPSLPTAVKLAFSVQPSNAGVQASIAPAVRVALQDASGNTVTSATNPVTLALVGGTGLGGTLTVTPQNGVATFSNLSVSNAGSYTLSASSVGLTGATSASFTVSSTATCSITSFGAVGDGVTNNASAIQNTFNYAATNNCTALIPAGTFAYSGTLTARAIAVTGTGASSILKALDTNNEALTLTGNGGSISNLAMQGTGSTRNVTYQAAMIWVNGATNFTVQNVLINGGSCVGIYDAGGQTGLIQNNTVENTLADSITNTNGASGITVKGNRVVNSGDDGISNNSYLSDSNTVHNITVQGNTIMNNKWGRGLEVSGGSNITFTGNYVDNLDGYADMYVASEMEWNTQNVSTITVTGNTFVDGGPNQGTAIIYNSEAGSTTINGVNINGNQFVNPKAGAVQFAGQGTETGIVIQNNTDFSTSAFSFSSNPTVSPTQTGNQVLAPSTYTTPLVSPGGGCSFAGC